MADVVQLKENGIFKYLKTHVGAVEELDKELAKLEPKISDSGWVDLVPKNGATGTARVRKIKNKVEIEFLIKGVAAGTGGSNSVVQLPAGYRPASDFSVVVGTNSATAMGIVRISAATGDVSIWKSDLITATHSLFDDFIAGGE